MKANPTQPGGPSTRGRRILSVVFDLLCWTCGIAPLVSLDSWHSAIQRSTDGNRFTNIIFIRQRSMIAIACHVMHSFSINSSLAQAGKLLVRPLIAMIQVAQDPRGSRLALHDPLALDDPPVTKALHRKRRQLIMRCRRIRFGLATSRFTICWSDSNLCRHIMLLLDPDKQFKDSVF
jgi:hypothetical protein